MTARFKAMKQAFRNFSLHANIRVTSVRVLPASRNSHRYHLLG